MDVQSRIDNILGQVKNYMPPPTDPAFRQNPELHKQYKVGYLISEIQQFREQLEFLSAPINVNNGKNFINGDDPVEKNCVNAVKCLINQINYMVSADQNYKLLTALFGANRQQYEAEYKKMMRDVLECFTKHGIVIGFRKEDGSIRQRIIDRQALTCKTKNEQFIQIIDIIITLFEYVNAIYATVLENPNDFSPVLVIETSSIMMYRIALVGLVLSMVVASVFNWSSSILNNSVGNYAAGRIYGETRLMVPQAVGSLHKSIDLANMQEITTHQASIPTMTCSQVLNYLTYFLLPNEVATHKNELDTLLDNPEFIQCYSFNLSPEYGASETNPLTVYEMKVMESYVNTGRMRSIGALTLRLNEELYKRMDTVNNNQLTDYQLTAQVFSLIFVGTITVLSLYPMYKLVELCTNMDKDKKAITAAIENYGVHYDKAANGYTAPPRPRRSFSNRR